MLRIILVLAASVSAAFAQGVCSLVGTSIYAQEKATGLGTYLGLVSDNPYATESIMNKFGSYGSKYSSTSILNEFGTFGSKYSSYSPYNPYSTSPPVIVDPDGVVAYLSKNRFLGGTTVDPDVLLSALAQGCGGIWNPPVRTKPDLIVDSIIAIISKNKDSLYFGYIVANVGVTTASSFTVGVVANGVNLGPISFPAIAPGYYEYDIRSFKLNKDTTHILIFADFAGAITEENDQNNIGTGTFLTPMSNPTATRRNYAPSSPMSRQPKRFNILGRSLP